MRITQQSKSIFMGDSYFGKTEMGAQDKIAIKKQLYQKEAMHVVTSVNDSEKRIDKSVGDVREHLRLLMQDHDEAAVFLSEARQKMQQARTDYNVEEDSQEEKDLELLKKEYDIQNRRTAEKLTDEEQERLENMGEMTEYQKYSMDLYAQSAHWEDTVKDTQEEVVAYGKAIRSVKIDRLKSHAMVDAEVAKEKMMEAAAKEAVGILKDAAVDAIDQKAEEIQEAAEARQEKEEEKEERIEAAKEKKEEAAKIAEEIRENASELAEGLIKADDTVRDVDKEAKKLLQEAKLLEEELKGLTVDAGV